MRGRYQIIISSRPASASTDSARGFWAHFKAALIGIGFLVVAVGVLAGALIFGSILAAALWVCLVLIIGAVILKGTWQRLNR